MKNIATCLWFDDQAEEAAKFYTSVFKNSKILKTVKYSVETPSDKEAVSFIVPCEDQAEIDYYWERLSSVPESEVCGWCKDRYGVSWQVVPKNMAELSENAKAMEALLKMKKLDIKQLQAAAAKA
jgi:predicted 3-demethylubiquinone-9 3-methyltransferase (glyoxalase superfamily)